MLPRPLKVDRSIMSIKLDRDSPIKVMRGHRYLVRTSFNEAGMRRCRAVYTIQDASSGKDVTVFVASRSWREFFGAIFVASNAVAYSLINEFEIIRELPSIPRFLSRFRRKNRMVVQIDGRKVAKIKADADTEDSEVLALARSDKKGSLDSYVAK